MNPLAFLRGRKGRVTVPAFGGDIRPSVVGPANIKSQLARLAFFRVFLSTVLVTLALVCLALAIRTPSIMGTELFVGDGSAVGCHVEAYEAE